MGKDKRARNSLGPGCRDTGLRARAVHDEGGLSTGPLETTAGQQMVEKNGREINAGEAEDMHHLDSAFASRTDCTVAKCRDQAAGWR